MIEKSVEEILKIPHLVLQTHWAYGNAYSLSYLEIEEEEEYGGNKICRVCSVEIERYLFRELTKFKEPDCSTIFGQAWDIGGVRELVSKYRENKYDIIEYEF